MTSRIATFKRLSCESLTGISLDQPFCDVERRCFGVPVVAGNDGIDGIDRIPDDLFAVLEYSTVLFLAVIYARVCR